MRDKQAVKLYNKLYRESNKEKVKRIQKDYYDKHRLKRIQDATNWRLNNKDKQLKTRQSYLNTPRGRLNSIKASANTRNISFSLSEEQAINIMTNKCYYCGATEKIGIDRVDSKFGYLIDNCLPCCSMCNYMKNIFTKEQFISQCKKVAELHSILK